MSNYRALGFELTSREQAEALARAPVRRAEGQLRLFEGRSLQVHRLEVGGGIELWTIRDEARILATFPTFHARRPRWRTVAGLGGENPLLPRLVCREPALTAHLVNSLFCPPGAFTPGRRAEVALVGLAAAGIRAADEPFGLRLPPPGAAESDIAFEVGGRVAELDTLHNPVTGHSVVWVRLTWDGDELELVARDADAPDLAVGGLAGAVVTLRAAVVGLDEEGRRTDE